MSQKINKYQDVRKIKRLNFFIIAGYALIVLVTVAVVTGLALNKTDESLKKQTISMTSSLGVQMKLNADSFFKRMEDIATLAFGEKLSYTYDATDPQNDEYEALNTEKEITERLYSLCIMENFVDYGIVYRNNRTVGKISNGTGSLFEENLYTELESMIENDKTEDGWFTGYNNDYRRIYYVKRVHENAVLFISFYTYELNEVFGNPETLADMDIRLVNENYRILYSKKDEPYGTPIPDEIMDRIKNHESTSMMDDGYMVSVNKLKKWYVICSIPTDIILSEKNEMTRYIYIMAALAAFIAALLGTYFSHLLTRSVESMVLTLDDKAKLDQLTGTLNKLTFEELSARNLEHSKADELRAILIFDLDNFKSVNDTYGHAAGDRILESTGEILRKVFTENDYIGRIGGDEFCVLVNSTALNVDDLTNELNEKAALFQKEFSENKIAAGLKCQVSASIGIALFPKDGMGFEALYKAADKALYKSKESGKNMFSFYH